MAENAPRWPMMIGTYFKIVGGFVMAVETGIHFCARQCEWLGEGGGGGAGALREPMD